MSKMHTAETTTPSERRVYDCLVKADLWLSAEELAAATALPLPRVQDALYLLCDGESVTEADGTYRAC